MPQRRAIRKALKAPGSISRTSYDFEWLRLLSLEIYCRVAFKLFRITTIPGVTTKFRQHSASSNSEGSVLELSHTTLRLTSSVKYRSPDPTLHSIQARVSPTRVRITIELRYVSAGHTPRRLDALARIASGSTSSLTSMSHRFDVVTSRRLIARSSENRVDFIRYQESKSSRSMRLRSGYTFDAYNASRDSFYYVLLCA
jgi:hypothetical protein